MILSSDTAKQLSSATNYFFPLMNKEIKATLNLEDYNNNMVLTAEGEQSFGRIHYNLNDETFKYFDCPKIYIRVPGEHIINSNNYDMELQLFCTGTIPWDQRNTYSIFVAIPVKKGEQSDKFFDTFEGLNSLPFETEVKSFESLLNPSTIFNKIYYYLGSKNFPECDYELTWMIIDYNTPITVSESLITKFRSLMDESKTPYGNARVALPPLNEVSVIMNKFK